jgi:sec-independent protein translocase protein TatA
VPFSPPANIAGPDGLIVVLVIAIVLFGSTQIPKIARSLGSAQKEFKKGLEEGEAEGDAKDGAKDGAKGAAPAEGASSEAGPGAAS